MTARLDFAASAGLGVDSTRGLETLATLVVVTIGDMEFAEVVVVLGTEVVVVVVVDVEVVVVDVEVVVVVPSVGHCGKSPSNG